MLRRTRGRSEGKQMPGCGLSKAHRPVAEVGNGAGQWQREQVVPTLPSTDGCCGRAGGRWGALGEQRGGDAFATQRGE